MHAFPVFILVHRRECRAALLPGSSCLPLFQAMHAAATVGAGQRPLVTIVRISGCEQLREWIRTSGCHEVCWGARTDTQRQLIVDGRLSLAEYLLQLDALQSARRAKLESRANGARLSPSLDS